MAYVAPMADADSTAAAKTFRSASPFPYLVLDGLLQIDEAEIDSAFPALDWPHWRRFRDNYQRGKRFCQDLAAIPSPFHEIIIELCSPNFLTRLERLTGIPKLLPDLYLDGGGLHVSEAGGVLAPHTDFHLYQRLDLYRAVNLLIYLNPSWSRDDGAELELFAHDSEIPTVSIAPTFNRAVIFRTDDRSVHGFTRPVGVGRERRSIALYYYTSREHGHFSGDTSTHWRARRHAIYDALIFSSRTLAKLARMVDPNAKEPILTR